MTKQINCKLEDLPGLLEQGARDIETQVGKAIDATSRLAVGAIRKRTPVAFGDLKNSVHADERKTVVSAPHAGAVEIGSRPHTPDYERLLAWVKLRGMQGVQGRRAVRKMEGPTTAAQAMKIAGQLKDKVVRGKAGKNGRYSPIDAAEQVTRAIMAKIEKTGTKPHWFVLNSLPDIEKILHKQVRSHLKK